MHKVGIDEAGRGSLAGPVVSAAVIIKKKIEGVDDSKSLSFSKREALFYLIKEHCVALGIGIATCEEIESMNILNATLLSMKRAVSSLSMHYSMKFREELKDVLLLIDGNRKIKDISYSQKAIVGGDKTVYEISAASIIAKVTRDRIMISLSRKYPGYGFEKHMGYATGYHIQKIREEGPSDIHRRSFLKKILYDEQKLFG